MLPTSPSGLARLRGRIVSTGLLRPASTLVLVLLGWSGCAHGTALRREYAEVHMAMPVRMVVYATGDSLARAAARAAFGRIAALELILSDYRPQSELRALERAAGNWVVVSADLFRVLEQAVHVARETGGAFDPTVGPVVALWR
ncbi:MAG TPA: FAD:protein FMN transferase, partial [Gemmatimonadaceae bacterium]|nr:FAD:protein FMN transferase [Gemmatimonadaceae bacterium]